jgi:hypothetical protein
MGTPASPFSDGSNSIDSRVNQDLGSRPARPSSRSPLRQPAIVHRALDLGPTHVHEIAIVTGGTEVEKKGSAIS